MCILHRSNSKMISTWIVLFFCVTGALCAEPIGQHPAQSAKTHSRLDIYGGKTASISKYPYIASLLQYGTIFGSAVILNKNWLLTTGYTAGWVSIDDLSFRVGSNFYSKGGQELTASKVILHPNYTGSWDWDIAVIKTTKPIKLGDDVKPIKLGQKSLKGNTKAWVAGWGEYDSSETPSKSLRAAKVTVYDWKKCATTYSSSLTPRLMCSFDKKVAPCIYDFGDPLVVKGALYGLFAGGYGCEPDYNPVLYTDIPSLASWVQATIKSEEDKLEE